MKNCTNCKHADWKKTAAGKMHPSGDGLCTYEVKIPPLPASKNWGWGVKDLPNICGGFINRRTELANHCTYYARSEMPS